MLRDPHHAERRARRPRDEKAFIAEGQFEQVGEFAVDESDEDGVLWGGVAFGVVAGAEDEAEGVGGLVPGAVFEGGGLGGFAFVVGVAGFAAGAG